MQLWRLRGANAAPVRKVTASGRAVMRLRLPPRAVAPKTVLATSPDPKGACMSPGTARCARVLAGSLPPRLLDCKVRRLIRGLPV